MRGDHAADRHPGPFVAERKRHDFQSSIVIGQPDVTIAYIFEQRLVRAREHAVKQR
jgi:hypothetical protein